MSEGPPSREEIQQALEQTLASSPFAKAPQVSAFLAYVVREAAEGRGARLNAYAVATEALGRGPAFEPQTDPLVRVTARRVRDALAAHALGAGADAPIQIVLPVGTYAPRFVRRDPHEADVGARGAASTSGWGWPLTLKGAAAPGALALFAAALFALVIGMVGPADQGARLSAASPVFPRLAVEVTSDGDPDLEARRAGAARSMIARFDDIVLLSSQTPLEPDYRLVLAFEESADGAALTARLEQVDLGVIAWTQRFEPQSDRVDDRDGLGRVLSPLLSPYGVLFAEVAGRAEDDVGFACVARAYQYFDDESRSRRIAAQGCLAELIASGVEHPTLYALQSWLHLDSHRLSDPIAADDGDPLAAAIDDAQSAVRANPGSARAHQALLDVMKVAGNHGTAEEAARRAMAANPFDLDVMTDYGAYLVSRGDFARAKPIMEKAHELSLRSPAWFDAYRALLYWGLQDRRAASEAIAAIRPGRSAIGDVMVSVLAHERGDRGLRSEALASLLAKEPAFADNPLARILRRGFAPRFAERLARALKRAMDADGAELGVADDAAD